MFVSILTTFLSVKLLFLIEVCISMTLKAKFCLNDCFPTLYFESIFLWSLTQSFWVLYSEPPAFWLVSSSHWYLRKYWSFLLFFFFFNIVNYVDWLVNVEASTGWILLGHGVWSLWRVVVFYLLALCWGPYASVLIRDISL